MQARILQIPHSIRIDDNFLNDMKESMSTDSFQEFSILHFGDSFGVFDMSPEESPSKMSMSPVTPSTNDFNCLSSSDFNLLRFNYDNYYCYCCCGST